MLRVVGTMAFLLKSMAQFPHQVVVVAFVAEWASEEAPQNLGVVVVVVGLEERGVYSQRVEWFGYSLA